MCERCKNAWDDEAPPDAEWDRKYDHPPARYAAEKAWTAKWCERRKARAA